MMSRTRALIPLLAVWLVGACTFDPLAGWSAPEFGSVTVGQPSDGFAADVERPDVGPPPVRIDSVTPPRGDPAGDEPVVLVGAGFTSGVQVFFGDRPGLYPQSQEGERVFVRTPPGEPGLVDVRVELSDGRSAVLRDGYLYGRPLRIHQVIPAHGPPEGGTPLTIEGEGFLPDTELVLGGRRLIELDRVDDGLIIGVTPGGAAGPVDIIATNAVGTIRARHAFLYKGGLRLDAVEPPCGPAAGGEVVTLSGAALSRDTEVRFGDERATILDWDAAGRALHVRTPAGPPGAVDVTVASSIGGAAREAARLIDGYTRIPATTPGALSVLSIHPSSGSAAGSERVTLAVSGLSGDELPAVDFGDRRATLATWDARLGLIEVLTPAATPGTVDVSVSSGDSTITAPSAYRFTEAFGLSGVAPDGGSVEGGETITIFGVGLASSGLASSGLASSDLDGAEFDTLTRVRVGALPASDVRVIDENTIRCTTPPGAPGAADLVVESGDHIARLTNGFHYRTGEMRLYGISPSQGAVAGGTYVELYGADIPARPTVRFGHRIAENVTRLSATRVVAYAPMTTAPGSVDVALLGPGGTDVLRRGYTYFDPRGSGPGTWGGPIDGAVNVTVLWGKQRDPVPNAFVTLDAWAETPYQGWTNANGQVTLSGPGLGGPRAVTAAAIGYSASTVLEVDAKNVVLLLSRDNPPSSGSTVGEGLPNGDLTGRVEGVEKYVPVPIVSCDDRQESAPLCLSCETDADCQDDTSALTNLRCSDLGADGLRCTSACGEGCPDGFACTPLQGEARCVPSRGERGMFCQVTRRAPFWPNETGPADVDLDAAVYQIESRPGEIAVVCVGGYSEWGDGAFVPTRMGVLRHAFAESGDIVTGQDIALDIPLSRTVAFRLDPPQPAPGEPWSEAFDVYLDLGSDGVFMMAEALRADDDGVVTLPYAPATFTDSLYDAGLTVFAGRYSPNDTMRTPYAETYRERLSDEDLSGPQLLVGTDDGRFETEDLALTRAPRALWENEDGERFIVGERGLLVTWRPDRGWWPQPSLGDARLDDIDGSDREHVWAVGAGGSIFRFNGLMWTREPTVTNRDLRSIWVAGPDRFIAVGDHRIVEFDGTLPEGERWTVLKVAADLFGVSGRHWQDVWAVGAHGAMLSRGSNGWDRAIAATEAHLHGVWVSPTSSEGFAVGAHGTLLQVDDGAWEPSQQSNLSGDRLDTTVDLFDVYGRSDDDVVAVGDSGVVIRWDGLRWERVETSASSLVLRGVYATSGAPWTALGPRTVTIGPLLPVIRLEEPRDGLPWNQRSFRWHIGEEGSGADRHGAAAGATAGATAAAVMIDLISATGGSRWGVLGPGHIRAFELPDLARAAGFTPIPPGTTIIRSRTALWPSFDINRLRGGATLAEWVSWTYDYRTID